MHSSELEQAGVNEGILLFHHQAQTSVNIHENIILHEKNGIKVTRNDNNLMKGKFEP